MMTEHDMIRVLDAYLNGNAIECRYRPEIMAYDDWAEVQNPSWDFMTFDYRVKPEPEQHNNV